MTAVSVPAYARLSYWREVLDRAGRNAVQTVLPVLIAAQVGSVTGLDPVNVLWVAALDAFVTIPQGAVRAHRDRRGVAGLAPG